AAVDVEVADAGRAEHVVDRPGIGAGMAADAGVRSAARGPVTSAARDRVVARQLLVPEEDLAEHALRLGDRVLGGDRHRRQAGDSRDRQSERGEETDGEGGAEGPAGHRGILAVAETTRAARGG